MVYLVIMLLVAAAGMGILWLQQRRERSHLESVESFKSSLEKISPEAPSVPVREATSVRKVKVARAGAEDRAVRLDPGRREAARKRIEDRRRAALAKANSRRQVS